MTKTATITIQLVPEADKVANTNLKKQIIKSLSSDWLLDVQNVEFTKPPNQQKK